MLTKLHHLAGVAAEVVGEGEVAVGGRGDLAVGGRLTAELQPGLEHHAQARRADGVAERLEAAVGVHGQVAGEVEGAGLDLLPRGAPLAEAEVLHEHELGGREAVVHLRHGQLGARVR